MPPDASTAPSAPMRVLHVVPGSNDGLTMVFAHAQIAALEAQGIETRTFLFTAGTSSRRVWAQARALRQVLREYGPDIVHAHYGSLTAFVCALVSPAPLVITYRGSDLNPSPTDGRVRSAGQKLLSQLAALRARGIICVSRHLTSRLWWGDDRAAVAPSGVDLELFRPMPRGDARRALNWPLEERTILFYAGRRPEGKRLDLAEGAVAVVRELIGHVHFAVLRGEVRREEMPVYLNAADCLLMASDYEGSPNIVKEALACGLPIVTVEVGDVVERLRGVRPSRIVARHPLAIGRAAAEILESGARSNGPGHVHAVSTSTSTDQVLTVYRRVLA